MIKEIIQFVDALPEEAFSKNLELQEGLYMLLDIRERGDKPVLVNVNDENKILEEDSVNVSKKRQPANTTESRLLSFYHNSLVLSANKSYLGRPGNFIEVGSPFCIRINKEIANKFIEGNEKDLEKSTNDLLTYFNTANKFVSND